ncbi:MAG: hypothetical protein AB1384_12490 [Actinomycetota bacterium]
MAFTKKEIQNDKALYSRVISTIDQIAQEVGERGFDDPTLVDKYETLLCKGPTLLMCEKVKEQYGGTSPDRCKAAGCPLASQCFPYIDILWRCGRTLLFLSGRGGYKSRESMENRCRACVNYEVCNGTEGAERARRCIAYFGNEAKGARVAFVDALNRLV